ncbi:MBL fold metallo-hydrolase [Bacteroidota bacterium]
MKLFKLFNIILLTLLFLVNCSYVEEVKMISQKTGPINTNCYLIYGLQSREAALIDVGGNIDTLNSFISDKKLGVKYIFITHCHPDHIKGIPSIRKMYPDAKLCFTRQEYEDMKLYENWETIFDTQLVEAWSADSVMLDLMTYDYDIIGEPDIYVKDNDIFKIGNVELKLLETPGHSRGSITIHIDNYLFCGDLLFYHSDGNMACTLTSMDSIKKSIKRLYDMFPDQTTIYPGHFMSTSIGSEKKENKNASLEQLQNL